MAFAENLAGFFDKATGFAEDIRIGDTDGLGIFDAPVQNALDIVGATDTAVTVATADFPYAAQGDTVRVRNTDYKIAGLYPDGTGMTRLVLKK